MILFFFFEQKAEINTNNYGVVVQNGLSELMSCFPPAPRKKKGYGYGGVEILYSLNYTVWHTVSKYP